MKINRFELIAQAKRLKLTIPQIQLLLAQERFIVRILNCKDGNKLVWKGGSLILRAYQKLEKPRYTVDIDLLAKGIPIPKVDDLFIQACSISLDDGFVFADFTKSQMTRETPYGGDRYEINWLFNKKPGPQTLKIDVCAGDKVETLQESFSSIAIFSSEDLSVQIYPPEFIFAEKLQAISKLKTGNTRTKDIVDLWNLGMSADKKKVFTAIQDCYQNRNTRFDLEEILNVLEDETFRNYHSSQIKKKFATHGLPEFSNLISDISLYLKEIVNSR